MTNQLRSLAWLVTGVIMAMVLLASSTTWQAEALPGPEESTIVAVTPARILDTRDPTNLGLSGPFVSPTPQKLQVTGSVMTATGTMTVVPTGATGVLLNVTSINSTANGFVSIRPGNATGPPTTSSLNFLAGQTVPNAVQVSMPTTGTNAGEIDITYDALGVAGPTTDIFIDVVGYTTNTGLQDVVTQLGAKANTADVYTRTASDARYVPQGDIVLHHGTAGMAVYTPDPPAHVNYGGGVTSVGAGGRAGLSLPGPDRLGTVDYGLRSVEWCLHAAAGGAVVDNVFVYGGPHIFITADTENRTTPGCYTVTVNDTSSQAYEIVFDVQGAGSAQITHVHSTWAPETAIP